MGVGSKIPRNLEVNSATEENARERGNIRVPGLS